MDPRLEAITRAASLLPKVTFFTLPGHDHSATHKDADAVTAHAISFLANVTASVAARPPAL
jgi:hypothetical protein